ncbi:homoserine dehydrogenase [Zobellella denitrificans]|uniref:homoserine dehydrogenase n=1 Tax=Zobellella denitrificans TaxID=347534 RepID=A0A291HTM4_9GAMM|nr:homoserine dehydrogenase [Zobellella denitrificans]ATG75505.1 homoserine dehydrogenase [Zobellella denitrificans]
MAHNVAILGFGVVGQGLAEILHDKAASLREGLGFDARIVAVSDLMKGSLYHPHGLDIPELLKAVRTTGSLDSYPDEPGLVRGRDSFDTIRESNADTVVELTYTDGKTGQPAIDHCRLAFECKKNVVMSNKGPVSLAYESLARMAEAHGVRWGFEGTVMSGTPALRMPLVALSGNDISEVRGILNGTTNFMLTRMAEGVGYDDALAEAQAKGYAEADPTSDVEGYDAQYKTAILANVVMGIPLKREDILCRGIRDISPEDIARASREGKIWKLLARCRREGGSVQASVGPVAIPLTDPLAGVGGALNAITYECDLAGPITLIGPGAGKTETGYSILIDLINIHRHQI